MAVCAASRRLVGPGDQVGSGSAGLQPVGQRSERGHEQHGRPGRHQVGRQVRVGRLQRVVPVAVAVCRQGSAGDAHLRDAVQGTPQVLLHGRRGRQARRRRRRAHPR